MWFLILQLRFRCHNWLLYFTINQFIGINDRFFNKKIILGLVITSFVFNIKM